MRGDNSVASIEDVKKTIKSIEVNAQTTQPSSPVLKGGAKKTNEGKGGEGFSYSKKG